MKRTTILILTACFCSAIALAQARPDSPGRKGPPGKARMGRANQGDFTGGMQRMGAGNRGRGECTQAPANCETPRGIGARQNARNAKGGRGACGVDGKNNGRRGGECADRPGKNRGAGKAQRNRHGQSGRAKMGRQGGGDSPCKAKDGARRAGCCGEGIGRGAQGAERPGRAMGRRGNGRQAGLRKDMARLVKTEIADETIRQALRATLLDEYANELYYQSVLDKFDAPRCFENLRRAEQRHAAALLTLFERYGVEPPSREEATAADVPATLREATQLAVESEINNGALYEKFLESIEQDDIRSVFQRLRYVSLNHHLVALRRQL